MSSTVFSIIIPYFNSYELVIRCLKSLSSQTFKNFQVILIDDCSTDGSFEKLSKLVHEYEFEVMLLRNAVNSGPGPTRNLGLLRADGDYIMFVDSDDYLDMNTLSELHRIILEYDPDCIIFDFYINTRGMQVRQKSVSKVSGGFISKQHALIHSRGSTWGKVYKTDILISNSIRFPNLRRNEDMPFAKIAISHCDKIYYLAKPLYHYVMEPTSLMHNIELLSENNALESFQIVQEHLEERFPYEVEGIFLKELLYSTVRTKLLRKVNIGEIRSNIDHWTRRYPTWYLHPELQNMSWWHRICLKLIKDNKIMILQFLVHIRMWVKNLVKIY